MHSILKMNAALERVRIKFLNNDAPLLDSHAHERTVTHRVAVYLEAEFPDWDVDCEYNRQGFGMNSKEDEEGNRRYPDVIVHHRGRQGAENNLLVLEAKPIWASEGRKAVDKQKLNRMVDKFDYQHAYFLTYTSGHDANLHFERVAGTVKP